MNDCACEALESIHPNGSEQVFGHLGNYETTKTMVREIFNKAHVTGYGLLHRFRHTFITNLVRNGADIETVRQLAGHSSITVTQRYCHSSEELKRTAVERLPFTNIPQPEKRTWVM